MNTWRAGCGGSRTSGSEGGPEKPASREAGRALRSDPYAPVGATSTFRCWAAVPTSPAYPSCTALSRITIDPAQMGGRPCIRGLRVTVGMILSQLAAGRTIEDVLEGYTYLERDDVLAALDYAAAMADERELPVSRPASGSSSTPTCRQRSSRDSPRLGSKRCTSVMSVCSRPATQRSSSTPGLATSYS